MDLPKCRKFFQIGRTTSLMKYTSLVATTQYRMFRSVLWFKDKHKHWIPVLAKTKCCRNKWGLFQRKSKNDDDVKRVAAVSFGQRHVKAKHRWKIKENTFLSIPQDHEECTCCRRGRKSERGEGGGPSKINKAPWAFGEVRWRPPGGCGWTQRAFPTLFNEYYSPTTDWNGKSRQISCHYSTDCRSEPFSRGKQPWKKKPGFL